MSLFNMTLSLSSKKMTPWSEEEAKKFRELGYWQDKTLNEYLIETANKYPDNIAIICGERQWRYSEFVEKSASLASGFRFFNINKGDTVVLHLTNIGEFYLCFFALLQIGAKPVLALPAHRFSEVSYFCEFTTAKAYIVDANDTSFDYLNLAHQVKQKVSSIENIFVVGESSEFITLSECYKSPMQNLHSSAEEVAFYQLSGGTTGTPKLIPRTHNDYAYSVTASVEICQFDQQTRYLCVLPAAHNFSLSSPGALGVFWAGGCVVLCPDPSAQSAFNLIERRKVTVSALVPPLALLWLDYAEHYSSQLASLKLLQVGGAKLSQAAAIKIPKYLTCQLQQVFGMAEGLVNYTRLDDPLEVIVTTQGRPISPLDEVKVVDDNDKELPLGQVGHLLTKGPYTIRGYYKAHKHNQRAFTNDGFYRTGDLVKLTETGNFIVEGRHKDQINRGGEKIAAEEIENLLLTHEKVHDVALIAVPDEYLGERSCAIIVSKKNEKSSAPRPIELKRYLREFGIAEYKIPDQIKLVDLLPKTPVGKINKNKLKETYAALA